MRISDWSSDVCSSDLGRQCRSRSLRRRARRRGCGGARTGMNAFEHAAPAIAMIAAFALVIGGIVVIRKGEYRRKGVLMRVLAAVLLGNVLTRPTGSPGRRC